MIVTKDYPVIGGEATTEHPHGEFEVILSAPTLDRDKEIVDAKAFEPLPDHITFDTDHSMTCDSVVGSGVPAYAEDGTLRVKGGFCSDDRSQVIRQKVADGHIRTTSVTFLDPVRTKDAKGVMHVTKAELLNGTFTPVPSNRESVVLAAKSILELAHAPVIPDAAKSIVGSLEAQRERVSDALDDAYPRRYCYIRGVLPDTVVFDVWSDDGQATWQQTYTDDGAAVTLTGDPIEVDVMEVVMPDADNNSDDKSAAPSTGTEKSADQDADTAAAKAAAGSASTSADDVDLQAARIRALTIHATANV